jgi:formylglycine-generating enzyme required for sulfatase activity
MVSIPAGPFLMGADPRLDEMAHARESPQHRLFLPAYSLARTPVTNADFAEFVATTGHRPPTHWEKGAPPPGKARHPVVHVSWYDAVAYCRWLAVVTGMPYRLPSEAEWEKGASWDPSVREKRRYPWGKVFQPARCNSKEASLADTTPVGAYPAGASPYGLLDMAGNVFEWTCSLWGRDLKEPVYGYPYDPHDGREETGADHGTMRVLRGGAFFHGALYARTTHRIKSYPDYAVRTRGFRLCLDDARGEG